VNTETTDISDCVSLWLLSADTLRAWTRLPAWIVMWSIAFAIFLACKWLTWQRACRRGPSPSFARSLGYLWAWPGMDAASFLTPRGRSPGVWRLEFPWIPPGGIGIWSFATLKTAAGAGLIWLATLDPFTANPLLTGWVAMIGLVFFLHFGLFHLLALAWQRVGTNAQPLMRAPLLATSLADFWSTRWNTAFNTLAVEFAFRPLARRWGTAWAIFSVFLISGLVHETVISLPARGGFGLPTAYFVVQGLGVLAERSRWARRFGLGRGFRGWLFVVGCVAGPAFWLFHPPFIHNVILPMLRAISAT